ncbi:hypothetical protein AAAC51_30820 [Priestia megaterium]
MMQLGLDLSQKQLLKLAMTPELRQSINILNYSTADLVHYLHQQVNENPVIKLSAGDSQQKIHLILENSVHIQKVIPMTSIIRLIIYLIKL